MGHGGLNFLDSNRQVYRTKPRLREELCLGELLANRHAHLCSRGDRRTHYFGVALLAWARRAHSVRLAGARLAVCENGDIVTLHKRVDAVCDVLEHAVLFNVLAEDAVKDKNFAPTGCINRQTRGRRNLTRGAAEALGNEIEARVARLQWRSDADSCIS
jgi:hypothetical protein